MYISSLFLKNIRSYTETELKFSRGLNLLVGANNSGKSTIIKALYKPQKNNSLLSKQDIRKIQPQATIAVRFSDVLAEDFSLFRLAGNNEEHQDFMVGEQVTVLYRMSSEGQGSEKGFMYNPDDERRNLQKVKAEVSETGKQVNLFTFNNLPDKESEHNFIYPFFAKRKHHLSYHHGDADDNYRVHENLSNLAAKVQNLSNFSRSQSRDFVRLCEDILGFTVGLIPGEQNERKIGVFVSDSITIPLEAMGEGVLNVLGLIVILLTEDNKLFLIEELENDLHPAALKKLLELIISKSDKNQFVISTHSNIVVKYLGSLPETTLHQITWQPFEEKAPKSINVPTSQIIQVPSTPEARIKMLENLGYDLFDSGIYSGFLILEESSAEQIIKDFLIPYFAPSLENRLRTIAAQGATDLMPKFQDLHRLFLFVHIEPIYRHRAWAMGDGDMAGKENIEKLRKSFQSWPEGHFITFNQKAFEYYYPEQFQNKVNAVLEVQPKLKKREAKAELLREVVAWARSNPKEARRAFEVSAKEVIDLLLRIEKEMNI